VGLHFVAVNPQGVVGPVTDVGITFAARLDVRADSAKNNRSAGAAENRLDQACGLTLDLLIPNRFFTAGDKVSDFRTALVDRSSFG